MRKWLWLLDPKLVFNDTVCKLEEGGGVLSLPRRYVLELLFQFLSKNMKKVRRWHHRRALCQLQPCIPVCDT